MNSEHESVLNETQEGIKYDSIIQEDEEEVHSDLASVPPPPPNNNIGYSRGAISLDFERVVNEYSIQACRDRMTAEASRHPQKKNDQWNSNKGFVGHAGRSVTRWTLTAAAGLLTGLTTILIVSVTEELVAFRASRLSANITNPEDPNIYVFLRFSFFSWILAFSSSLLCVAWVPAAMGSGIPDVKAYLNGVRVKRFSSVSLFVVKIVGTILSVMSSLAVGKEGPLVHIGAIVGASCSKLSVMLPHVLSSPIPSISASKNVGSGNSILSRIWLWSTSDLAYFANDTEKRDLVTIGAAVGFAASFGAPIGGLLFILDDLSSFFSKRMFLRVLVANALGTFCLALYRGDLSQYSVINLGDYNEPNKNIFVNRFEEVPFYFLTGIIGGAMGGLYSSVLEFQKRQMALWTGDGKYTHLIYVTVLSVVTSFLLFSVTTLSFGCRQIPAYDHYLANVGHQFFCEEGEVNALATILLGSRDKAIRWILTDPEQFQCLTLLTVGGLFYFLTLATIGSALPLGVFTPTVLIGASVGGAGGILLKTYVDSQITPSTIALLGVAAMLAGVQRSTVSICVILVEGTGQIKVLIPVIITVVVARYVASLVHPDGIYEVSMSLKGYPFLNHKDIRLYDMFEVGDVMSAPVITVRPYEKAKDLVAFLERSPGHGFPVVDSDHKLLGIVRRNQIVALLECGVFEKTNPFESRASESWTPTPGVHKSPLMHWAYHIKDDRYQYLETQDHRGREHVDDLEDDEYDTNEYLLSVRDAISHYPGTETSIHGNENRPIRVAGDDTLPALNSESMSGLRHLSSELSFENRNSISTESSEIKIPTGFGRVGSSSDGRVVIKWLHPDHEEKFVNLSAVMNKGAFSLPDYFPLSKAYTLFTELGLRWIVVTGSYSGGKVVGILTRHNLLPSHIVDSTVEKKRE
ncbi:unnamed protein product [Cylindrotheca closterium]|uniref:Chloride channel protein n=1 Tax=Cylindrotheca closterium TaxID=2856 RepID=A0AAD2FSS7_9STRA|nr:unnamed protein product [Cylindrotheca closterium]